MSSLPLKASGDLLLNFIPSQVRTLLASPSPRCNQVQRHSGFPLHTITGFHWPELTLLRNHLPPRSASCNPWISPCFTLSVSLNTTGLPQLLSWLPVNDSILNHINGLIRFRAFPLFARLPSINAVSGSLSLCTVHFLLLPSDPAVSSNALASRIIFPLIGAMSVFFQLTGFASFAGQTKSRALNPAHKTNYRG